MDIDITIDKHKVEKIVRAVNKALDPHYSGDDEVKASEVLCGLIISYAIINHSRGVPPEIAIKNAADHIIDLYHAQDDEEEWEIH